GDTLWRRPSRPWLVENVRSLTFRTRTYSPSPRMKRLPHSMYSMPRPAVQPGTKLLERRSCEDCVLEPRKTVLCEVTLTKIGFPTGSNPTSVGVMVSKSSYLS